MAEQENKKGTMIQSLQVGFSVLQIISNHNRPMKFSEVLEESNITKSNLYKYMNTLLELGFIHRSSHTGKYSLGPSLVEFGMKAANSDNILEQAEPYLEEIQEYYNETVLFTRGTFHGPMIMKIINGSNMLNIGANIGSIVPVYSAVGKLFGAYETREIKTWKDRECAVLSNKEISELEKEFERVRETKISYAKEALASAASSIAIPILDFENKLIGTIAIVGFTERINEYIEKQLTDFLLQKQKEVSRIFGGQ
ncbi:IclR family transcriptional regulator [Salibacterium salarium]|uniref:IclR family transcriptional regulator n=1 Tax=Salibacterium salarium TaxID=284579 RepID=A0A3R9QRN0_9BACI|nr:IclR family transcriptional regulator C-terminal domain-containing protein [Salibacterium salarium]RSL31909.1 IclR family transcriptional regulator [Salibacterium salarium]